jgi:hypothetical protein
VLVWKNVLPDTPGVAPARAFLNALRGNREAMRRFRLAHRTEKFIASRPEEKHAEREELWLRDFGKAKLEGYSLDDGCRRLALYLSTPDEKWYELAMELEASKIAGIYVAEIRVPATR